MSDEHTAEVPKTFWFRLSGGAFYLIPDDADVPPGDVEIRTLVGAKRLVDEGALGQWVASEDAVRDHLKHRVAHGFQRFAAEVGEAWRRGVASAAAQAPATQGPEAASASEQADANARKIQEAAESIVSGLKELSEKLEQAVRSAADTEAAKARVYGERSDEPERHDGEPNGSGRA